MVPSGGGLEPVLFKRFCSAFQAVSPCAYKTKTDLFGNEVFTQFSKESPLTFLGDLLRKI